MLLIIFDFICVFSVSFYYFFILSHYVRNYLAPCFIKKEGKGIYVLTYYSIKIATRII
uniref:Uncharacterized protein n=1 Tax=Siphoviridae sp. ctUse40 TaxID=2826356 RepID=A0A8S5NCZ2_9CAUD|nr:MAG TPA: hypothetical protein [Siphoviridae sp. ctUse40]